MIWKINLMISILTKKILILTTTVAPRRQTGVVVKWSEGHEAAAHLVGKMAMVDLIGAAAKVGLVARE